MITFKKKNNNFQFMFNPLIQFKKLSIKYSYKLLPKCNKYFLEIFLNILIQNKNFEILMVHELIFLKKNFYCELQTDFLKTAQKKNNIVNIVWKYFVNGFSILGLLPF